MPTALITGASSGIGEQFAYALAERGYKVIIVARREERLQQVQSRIEAKGGKVHSIVADLLNNEDVERLIAFIHEEPIDLLVNNAGFGGYGLFQKVSPQREQDMITLNISTLVKLTRVAVESMLKRKSGQVINVASTAAFQPVPYMAIYAATKSFVLHYSEAIAAELTGTNVHVMALCPGGTATEFSDRAEVKGTLAKNFTMTPEQVVEIALKGLDKRKRIVVPGVNNVLMSKGYRIAPRNLLTNSLTKAFQKEKVK